MILVLKINQIILIKTNKENNIENIVEPNSKL